MTNLLALFGNTSIYKTGTEKMKEIVSHGLLNQDEADFLERMIDDNTSIHIHVGKQGRTNFKNRALRNVMTYEKRDTGSTITVRSVTPFHGDYVVGNYRTENGKIITRENASMKDVFTTTKVNIKRKDYSPHWEGAKITESNTVYVYIPTDRINEDYTNARSKY